MTRKHFEAIARILEWRNGSPDSTIDFDSGYNTAIRNIADDMADYFENENPRFDRERFLTACGF